MPKKKIYTIVIIILVIIALGAIWYILYGGSSSNNPTDANSYSPTKVSNSSKDIASYIQNDSSLSNFYKLLTNASLVDQLKTASSGTTLLVIVPNNMAFKTLPSSYSDQLLTGQNQTAATDITKYHMATVSIDTKNIPDNTKIKTNEGQEIIANLQGSKPIFTDAKGDQANVVKGPIVASNGTIYIVDAELLPQ